VNFEMMTDPDFQKKCVEAGHLYVATMYPGLRDTDIERASQIANGVAAGYSKGWKDKEEADANAGRQD
jgi:hypothetical protein